MYLHRPLCADCDKIPEGRTSTYGPMFSYRGDNERLSVGELETEINLTLSEDRQYTRTSRFFR
jgi:hypothetical protein